MSEQPGGSDKKGDPGDESSAKQADATESPEKSSQTYEECDDPELEDLLQSTLEDFASKPVISGGGSASGSGAAAGGGGGKSAPGEASAEWDEEKFIADATSHFEQSMRALLSGAQGAGPSGDTAAGEAEMSKVFEQIFQGLQPPAGAAGGPPGGVPADPLDDMLRMMSAIGMQAPSSSQGGAGAVPSFLGSSAEPPDDQSTSGGFSGGGGPAALLPIMSGLLKQVLSKDVLYPSLKAILERFPAYLEENRGKIKEEDLKRYAEQQRLMKAACDEFDSPDGADFDKIFALMQEMQTHGHPPKEVIDGADNPTDLSALGLSPNLPGGGQSDCALS